MVMSIVRRELVSNRFVNEVIPDATEILWKLAMTRVRVIQRNFVEPSSFVPKANAPIGSVLPEKNDATTGQSKSAKPTGLRGSTTKPV